MFDIFDTIAPGYTEDKKPKEVIKYGPSNKTSSESDNENNTVKQNIKKTKKKSDEINEKKIDLKPEEANNNNDDDNTILPTYNDETINPEQEYSIELDEKNDEDNNNDNNTNDIENDNNKEQESDEKIKDQNVELTFLENQETGHAIIGRKTSVFKKYC